VRDLRIVAARAVPHRDGLGSLVRAALALPLLGCTTLRYGHGFFVLVIRESPQLLPSGIDIR